MKAFFVAKDIPVMYFTDDEDPQGCTTPSMCVLSFDKRVPVTFSDNGETLVGWVTLRRVGDILLGDFRLVSTMSSTQEAVSLMRRLTPAAAFKVLSSHEKIVLHAKMTNVMVSPHGNTDPKVLPFGNRLHCISKGMLN
jgi:hypothetical protein